MAVLELGINVMSFDAALRRERVENTLRKIAGENPEKPIFVISPFYHCGDDFNKNDRAKVWREAISETVARLHYKNVTYINGFEVLGDASYMSADEVHPNIYGAARIAEVVTDRIRATLASK